jgi:hypothetical protein
MDRLSRIPLILVLAAVGVAGACGKEAPPTSGMGTHPLSSEISRIRAHVTGLSQEDTEALDNFVRTSNLSASPFELRRVSGLLGRGLLDADLTVVADFVLATRDHLYDDFFEPQETRRLLDLADVLRTRPGLGEIDRLRISAIVGPGKGVFSGTLREAMDYVSFLDAVAPRARNVVDLVPGEGASVTAYTGAGELLRLKQFVKEGGRLDLAVTVYRTAIDKWPDDPALYAGLVSLYLENADLYSNELDRLLVTAEAVDEKNAAFTYLRAARALVAGQDQDALEAFRVAAGRETVTFYELERARRIAKFLEGLGQGRLSALLTAYRTTSVGPSFELKSLVNRVVKRSFEYETAEDETSLETVVDVPITIGRQMATSPTMVFNETIRCRILVMGLSRKLDFVSGDDALKAELEKQAADAKLRLDRIEKASELCSGKNAWASLHDALGEPRFLEYVDKVIYGDEASFLVRCADATCLADALARLDQPAD